MSAQPWLASRLLQPLAGCQACKNQRAQGPPRAASPECRWGHGRQLWTASCQKEHGKYGRW
eukprot:5346097-Alexandrium_andersonii.AAC.1